MRVLVINLILLIVIAGGAATEKQEAAQLVSAAATDDREVKAKLVRHIQQELASYSKQFSDTKRALRVVYFCPQGWEPQKDYEGRIERIMFDVRDFYREGVAAYGVKDWALPLELVDGRLKIHLVRGKQVAAHYDYDSGGEIATEIKAALGKTIQFGREHVMVFHGLCEQGSDGVYRFHAPYYGSASPDNQSGICHAADCELLDPRFFKETKKRIRYTEHNGNFDQTLADFNTKYIGGVAHELGHALGLPHVSEAGPEGQLYGTALMGSGNHTYRRELWNPKRHGSFLTLASVVRLLVHPLYTQKESGRDRSESEISSLMFDVKGRDLLVQGQVSGRPDVFAVIAHVDPEGRSDYDSDAGVGAVVNNCFKVRLPCWKSGEHTLRLNVYHVNGNHRSWRLPFICNTKAEPDAGGLTGIWLIRRAEQALLAGDSEKAKTLANTALTRKDINGPSKQVLQHLLRLCAPLPKPLALSEVAGDVVYLSDLVWESAQVGWGRPARNQYWFSPQLREAALLRLSGTVIEKGLYAHAPSSYVFALDGKVSRFQATAGLQDGAPHVGTGVFIIRGDERELYRSQRLGPADTVKIDVDIQGVKRLELAVLSGKEGNACCWTIWANPRIIHGGGVNADAENIGMEMP